MIRKSILVISIIALVAQIALGNTPSGSGSGPAAKTTGAAEPVAMLQDCAFAQIKINQIKVESPTNDQRRITVSWTVTFVCAPVKVAGFNVTFILRNSRGEEHTVTTTIGPQFTTSTINVPRDKVPQFFVSSDSRLIVAVIANLALKNPVARDSTETVIQSVAPPASNLKLDITEIKINGSNRSNPATMQVTWTLDKPASARVESYNLTLDLSGNGVTGRVVQTPSSAITSVAVGLLGIPADVRAKLFDPNFPLTATVILKATIFSDGKRETVEQKETKTF